MKLNKRIEIKKDKIDGVTIGYMAFIDGEQKFYINESRKNNWNIYEGDSPISGWIDCVESYKEAKEWLLESYK